MAEIIEVLQKDRHAIGRVVAVVLVVECDRIVKTAREMGNDVFVFRVEIEKAEFACPERVDLPVRLNGGGQEEREDPGQVQDEWSESIPPRG